MKPTPIDALTPETPLEGLPGVGPVTAGRLAARGLRTAAELLRWLPRRYDDLRRVVPLGALEAGRPQLTRGRVVRARVVPAFRRRILELELEGDDGARLRARWFNFRGRMAARFPAGAEVVLMGTPRPGRGGALELAHPETHVVGGDEGLAVGVRPRYPEIEGVPARLLERLVGRVADALATRLPDPLPDPIRTGEGLVPLGEALRALHRPQPDMPEEALAALNAGTAPAQRRLAFEELFFLQLGILMKRHRARAERAHAATAAAQPEAALARLVAAAPFAVTAAQRRAVREVAADLAGPHPMQRLLQGDVGSGKTWVAWAAAELAFASGLQVALMAPTELLSEQHGRTLAPWARAAGRRVALLTSSTARAERRAIERAAAEGGLDMVLGTHALLGEALAFRRLGLAIVDEQHRFGVAQRAVLRDKGGADRPHLLVMTATPIPRSLAHVLYGDLDLTVLDELPPGREPPRTEVLVGARGRARALAAVRHALDEGRQAYWVCPLIEESETIDVADVTRSAGWLAEELGAEAVAVVHGRLPAEAREAAMAAFRRGERPLLCATSLIEVGVDVPAASLMVIEGAERFGLAQLHQLRGRVGRGGGRADCLLLTRAGGAPLVRLHALAETTDGFRVAEADLRQRGPGELFGTRQAGLPVLRHADLFRDADLLVRARDAASALLERDPALAAPEHAAARAGLAARWDEARRFGEEAG